MARGDVRYEPQRGEYPDGEEGDDAFEVASASYWNYVDRLEEKAWERKHGYYD